VVSGPTMPLLRMPAKVVLKAFRTRDCGRAAATSAAAELSAGTVGPQLLQSKGSLFFTRPTLAHYVAARGELAERSRELFAWVASGELSVRVGARYTLGQRSRHTRTSRVVAPRGSA
jgi:hypothetical protein